MTSPLDMSDDVLELARREAPMLSVRDVQLIQRAVLALNAENERLKASWDEVYKHRYALQDEAVTMRDTIATLHARERELCEGLREALHEWESWMPAGVGQHDRIAELRKLAGERTGG